MAEITPLNDNWGAQASAADALQRVPNDATFVAIWINPDGRISWTKANTELQRMALIAAVIDTWVRAWIDQDLRQL